MAVFKCKMCGGALEVAENTTVCECEYCGTTQTLPKLTSDKKANLYDRANHFRRNNDYDKAMSIYENVLNEDPDDAEAYWSLVLCRYGIEYVEDPSSHKRIPTVNRAQYTSIFADEDYKAAIEHADMLQKSVYEQEAKAIDEIQKGILEVSSKEEPFDVFICYKETDENGRRTMDSVLANDLYHQLTQEGFKVFFSRITLEDKLGSAYEPYIFAALNSAKVMVVLGTKPSYFNAVWVKNEWSRYLALIRAGQKKMLIPAYRDMDPYDLPEEFSHLQAQDMSKLGFMQDLIRGIKKIMEADAPKTQKETVVIQQTAGPANSNVAALLKRGQMALEDQEWDKADGFFEEVLNQDAENGEAYLGKFLAAKHKSCLESYKTNLLPDREKEEVLTACPEEKEHIEEVAAASEVNCGKGAAVYLTGGYIRTLYQYDRTYVSGESSRKSMKEDALNILRQDRMYSRVKQYMSGSTEEKVRKFEKELEEELDRRISRAHTEAEERKQQVIEGYQNHVAEADKTAEKMRLDAENKREADYLAACEQAASGNKDTIITAASSFAKLGNYKDSSEKKADAERKIAEIDQKQAEARAAAERAKKKKIGTIIGICATVAIAAVAFIIILNTVIIPSNKCKVEKAKIAAASENEIVTFGSYKGNDIEWIIVEINGEQATLVSRYLLEKKSYNDERENITWEDSTIRKWLNNDFISSAFSNAEQSLIVETSVTNSDNAKYGTDGGNNTTDKVYLLSIDEVNQYFSSDSDRKASYVDESSGSWWWLRSPGRNSYNAAGVNDVGSVNSDGYGVDSAHGIRPALTIDISNLK